MILQLTRNALKGQQQLAQGSALGGEMGANQRPTGAKAFALTARHPLHALTQGVALGYERVGPSGRSDGEKLMSNS